MLKVVVDHKELQDREVHKVLKVLIQVPKEPLVIQVLKVLEEIQVLRDQEVHKVQQDHKEPKVLRGPTKELKELLVTQGHQVL